MAATIYRGLSGVNRNLKEQYRGVAGVNRKVGTQYRGINGVNRRVFGSIFIPFGNFGPSGGYTYSSNSIVIKVGSPNSLVTTAGVNVDCPVSAGDVVILEHSFSRTGGRYYLDAFLEAGDTSYFYGGEGSSYSYHSYRHVVNSASNRISVQLQKTGGSDQVGTLTIHSLKINDRTIFPEN